MEEKTQHVLMIRRYLEHNSKCQLDEISRMPIWPVHPNVYKIALRDMQDGLLLHKIHEKN